jgi:hypothetical protein
LRCEHLARRKPPNEAARRGYCLLGGVEGERLSPGLLLSRALSLLGDLLNLLLRLLSFLLSDHLTRASKPPS